MNRPLLLVASRHPCVAAALHEFLELFIPQGELIHRLERCGFSCAAELFERLDQYPPEQLRDLMVLFDIGAETAGPWNVKDMRGESGLAAQLVLAYPEIYFVFVGASGQAYEPPGGGTARCWATAKDHHFVPGDCLIRVLELIELHAQGFRTIFDATGLRSFLKQELQMKVFGQSPSDRESIYRPFSAARLDNAAAVADEEAAFLYLNGYAAYKFGFRVWIAHTEAEFERLLGDSRDFQEKFAIALLDWHLTYRDRKYEGNGTPDLLKPLPLRVNACDSKKVDQPVVVTSFPDEVRKRNDETKAWRRGAILLPKPYGGLFHLIQMKPDRGTNPFHSSFWKRRNLLKNVFKKALNETVQLSQPPDKLPLGKSSAPFSAHSAPYSCSLVANRLLSRARSLAKAGTTETETWGQVALLAAEAKEILGGLSRTTAYEAVALQNEAEVHAEVSFFGTSAQMEVKRRLDVLEMEAQIVERAGRSAGQRTQRTDTEARLNCLLQTVNELRLHFAEHEQIAAVEACLRKFAIYDRKLKYSSWFSLFSPFRWAEWYADWVTRAGTSVWRLVWISGLLVLGFSVFYFVLFSFHPKLQNDPLQCLKHAAWQASFTFVLQPGVGGLDDLEKDQVLKADIDGLKELELQPGTPAVGPLKAIPFLYDLKLPVSFQWILWYHLVVLLELTIASVHLGLLISLLYRRITKRAP